jgi:hypothetical protein
VNFPQKFRDRNLHQSFATPYVFRPQLTLGEAVVAAGFAFLRIVIGSLLFAFGGTGMWEAWAAIHNPFWRVVAEVPLLVILVAVFGLLMYSISALNRSFMRRA